MKDSQDRPRRGTPDFQLLILTLLLVGFGIVMVFSSSSSVTQFSERFSYNPLYFTKKQIIFAGVGIFGMFITMNIPYEKFRKLFAPIFILAIILLKQLERPDTVLAIEAVYMGRATFPHGLEYESEIPAQVIKTANSKLTELKDLLEA